MRLHVLFSPVLILSFSTALVAQANYVGSSGAVAFDKTTQVPGDTLKAGSYSITVPEQIADRVIVRMDSTNSKDHAIFLGVPSTAAKIGVSTGLATWPNGVTKTPAIRGFVFSSGNAVEFVYPKAEAAALAKNNSAAVVAVDPRAEGRAQLKSLSKDELEIVNLWLLSLTTTGLDNKQPAVLARHYDATQNAAQPTVASSVAPVYPTEQRPSAQGRAAQPQPAVARVMPDSAPVATKQTQVATMATIAPVAPQPQPVPQAKRVRAAQPAAKNAPEVAKLEQPERGAVRRGPAMTQLPHTASSLPVVWMLGVLSLFGFGAVRFGRSFSRRIES